MGKGDADDCGEQDDDDVDEVMGGWLQAEILWLSAAIDGLGRQWNQVGGWHNRPAVTMRTSDGRSA